MKKKYKTMKVWEETLRTLRIISALSGKNMVEVINTLGNQELKKLQKR